MRKFYLVKGDTQMTMTESQVIRAMYNMKGVVGLNESLSEIRKNGYSVVVDDPKSEPFVLNESVILEGFFDSAKEKLTKLLKDIKDGVVTEDQFDKIMYGKEETEQPKVEKKSDEEIANEDLAVAKKEADDAKGVDPEVAKRNKLKDDAFKTVDQIIGRYRKLMEKAPKVFEKMYQAFVKELETDPVKMADRVALREKQYGALAEAAEDTAKEMSVGDRVKKQFLSDMKKVSTFATEVPDALTKLQSSLKDVGMEYNKMKKQKELDAQKKKTQPKPMAGKKPEIKVGEETPKKEEKPEMANA